jgi:hypothetical protein
LLNLKRCDISFDVVVKCRVTDEKWKRPNRSDVSVNGGLESQNMNLVDLICRY